MAKSGKANHGDSVGWTPLHRAICNGHFDVFKLIFEQVENKNPPDRDGFTPLHIAAYRAKLDFCKYIIEQVENKSPTNRYGKTPRDLAIELNRYQIVQLFDEFNTRI